MSAACSPPGGGRSLYLPSGEHRQPIRGEHTVRSRFDNPFLFTGRYFDAETGLLQYRNRYYDAHLGRFLSQDPLGYADGLNLYEYVGGNPLNAIDPHGYALQAAIGAAGGALLEGGIAAVGTLLSGGSVTDALREGALGAISGGIRGALICSGVPPHIANAIVGGIMGGARAAYESFMRMKECGQDVDVGKLLEEFMKGALKGAIQEVATGGIMRRFRGMGGRMGRLSRCAEGMVESAVQGAVDVGISTLGNCFLAGTLVVVLDDEGKERLKPIEEVQRKDKVKARDPVTGKIAYCEVTDLFRNETDVVMEITLAPQRRGRGERHDVGREGSEESEEPPSAESQTIRCTPGHEWMILGRGQVLARDLRAGDLNQADDDTILEVVEVKAHRERAKIYNFEVAGFHTFFVAERVGAPAAWVHNTSHDSIEVSPWDPAYRAKLEAKTGPLPEGWHADHVPAKGLAREIGLEKIEVRGAPGETNTGYSPFDAHQARKAGYVQHRGSQQGALDITRVNQQMHAGPVPRVQPMDPKIRRLLYRAANTGAEGYRGDPPRPRGRSSGC